MVIKMAEHNQRTIGIIPARFASTRFPGKPLVMIDGITMIERVYTQARKSTSLQKVIVATDNEEIFKTVKKFGGDVVITSPDHTSGTERCAEVVAKENTIWDVVINIQGDEPFIDPRQIDLLTSCFKDSSVNIATLIKKVTSHAELSNPNTPKVIINEKADAIYFSRQAIPFLKGIAFEKWHEQVVFYKHIGIYGYRPSVLAQLVKLPFGKLEQAESLEQLRWIEHGYAIRTAVTDIETTAIDTPEDLSRLLTGDVR